MAEREDNREWSENPTRPAIVIGTVDMVGSRLLFSGYGDSRKRRALHAGLLGQDALIVNDEAHLTRAFAALLKQLGGQTGGDHPMRMMLLTATHRQQSDDAFPANLDSDLADPASDFAKRYHAVKRLHTPRMVDKPKDEIRRLALQPDRRTVVFVRSPEEARDLAAAIDKEHGTHTPLITGTQRGYERDKLLEDPVVKRFLSKDSPSVQDALPCWLVSTSAGIAYVTGSVGARGSLVMKLDPTGTTAIYSTYIGGAGSNDIALDAAGNVYLTGVANPPDFPTTPGAYQTQQPIGSRPPFITKLNATGTALDYSTYLSPADGASLGIGPGPGPSFVLACCIAVDSAGSAYVTGTTRSKNFPTTPGAFQTRLDATWGTFVTKLNPTGTALSYSTYLGGGGSGGALLTGMTQASTGIAVDAAGNAYVAGWTGAEDFPTTPGALQLPGMFRFNFGGFVTKLNPTGSALVYSSLLREALPVTAMTVDSAGNVYVAGFNLTGEFPTTPGAFNAGAGRTAWLAKINDAGTTLVYAARER